MRDEAARMLRRINRSALSVVIAGATAIAVLAGCSEDPEVPEQIDTVKVSGEFGLRPTLTYPSPMEVAQPDSHVVWAGDGPTADAGETVLLNLYAQNATDASQIVDTFYDLPMDFEVTPESLGGVLYDAVLGQQAGARVLVLDQVDDVPIVLVLDVLAGQAVGEEVEPDVGMPQVERGPDGEPKITIPKELREQQPTELQVRPLLRGSGRQVTAGQTAIVQYTAISWSDGEVIDSTWQTGRKPFTTIVGDSRPIPAWDEALIEQTVGSQIVLVAPPALAYEGSAEPWADDAVVFVIDILYAGTIDAPEMTEDPGSDEGKNLNELDLDNSSDQ